MDFEKSEYLRLLARQFPTVQSAATEIINLSAILNLPKGTEHFMSDIHGEYEAFQHIMMNASGSIRQKIELLFHDCRTEAQRAQLATVVYYPREKMKELTERMTVAERQLWYRETLNDLIALCRVVTSKYTRSKVRKALPNEYAYVIDELIYTDCAIQEHADYCANILSTILDLDRAPEFIITLCDVIKRLIVDRLHLVGDIFDRGPRADLVMDAVMAHPQVDIQWGNHDIVWMGAACGSRVCIAAVLANSVRYNNLDVIEQGYGITLRPLASFANEYYANSNTAGFVTTIDDDWRKTVRVKDVESAGRMAKAIAVILFKLEGEIIRNHPEYEMQDRLLLDKIDWQRGTVCLNGKEYLLTDTDFPTVDPADPYRLSEDEEYLIRQLSLAFRQSIKLQRHVAFLYANGSIYKCFNGNLLFHGSVPMESDGSFRKFCFDGVETAGKAFLDYCDAQVRQGRFGLTAEVRKSGRDFMWWLWCGKYSPLFARQKMATFERRLIADSETWQEPKDAYYGVITTAAGCERVLAEFGLSGKHTHIINGHIPVRASAGESPVKGGGRLIVIDGGFCKAYQQTTGIAGYTLIYNSNQMALVSHEAFCGRQRAIAENRDIHSHRNIFDRSDCRIKIAETDSGMELQRQIDCLKQLIQAYRQGKIAEKPIKK